MSTIVRDPEEKQVTAEWLPHRRLALQKQELMRCVRLKTFDQIRDLSVDCDGPHIVLRGTSRSYYVKQLASHAVRDLFPGTDVENAVVVAND